IVRPENAPNPKGNPILADPQKFSQVGNSNYYVNGEGGIYRRVGEGAPGRIPLLPDEHARIAASDGAVSSGSGDVGHSGVFDAVTGTNDVKNQRPATDKPASKFVDGSTAPKQSVSVDGHRIQANQEVVIGRDDTADMAGVTRTHAAAIRVDDGGNYYIRDLNSDRGTYINGERIGPEHGEVLLKPDDRVNLGGVHHMEWGRQLEPTHDVLLGKRTIDLYVGGERAINSNWTGESEILQSCR